MEYILYTPFGATLTNQKTGTYDNDHKYTNKEQDEDSGLYYYGARYYNPEVGVFVGQDPVYVSLGTGDSEDTQKILSDPQMLNSYSYSRNNPINLYDPDGRWPSLRQMEFGTNFVANILSLGGWGLAQNMIDSANDRMREEGVNVQTVANTSGAVIAGTISSAAGAFVTGVEVGAIAVSTGLVSVPTARQTSDTAAASGTNFVVSPSGRAFPIPTGSTGPVPSINQSGRTTGSAFIGGIGGENGQVSSVRVMDPTNRYPQGYIKYENINKQGVDPLTGKTGSQQDTHFSL